MARKKLNLQVNPLTRGPSLFERTRSGSPYREIPLAEIDVDPDQPRRVFAEETLNELAESIKEYGVLCPVLVRPTEGGTYRLITGERRFRASKLAGLQVIPAVVDQGDETDTTRLSKQLVENLQRQDLTPMERSIAIGQLRDSYQWSVREIASRLGVSKTFVQRSLEIVDLPDDLQAALISGAAESKILLLHGIDNKEVRAQFLSQLDHFTRAQLEEEVRRIRALLESNEDKVSHGGTAKSEKAKRKALSPEDHRIVQDIQNKLGTKVYLLRSQQRQEQGRITLEFYSDQDLKEIYKRLTELS